MDKTNADLIDLEELLDDLGIDYVTSGKNISNGWIGSSCPFCDDQSTHLGINIERKTFNCWVCGEKGFITKLLMKKTGLGYQQVKDAIHTHTDISKFGSEPALERITRGSNVSAQGKLILPEGFKANRLNDLARKYLKSRDFDPDYILDKYKVGCCGPVGNFKFRIIIPVFEKMIPVSYVGADYTRKQPEKYKNAPNENSIIPIRQCVYGLDEVKPGSTVFLVEGILDKWRLGDGAVGLLSKVVTTEQLQLIIQARPRKVVTFLDKDADKQSEEVSCVLGSSIPEVIRISGDFKDPAELTDSEAQSIVNYFK